MNNEEKILMKLENIENENKSLKEIMENENKSLKESMENENKSLKESMENENKSLKEIMEKELKEIKDNHLNHIYNDLEEIKGDIIVLKTFKKYVLPLMAFFIAVISMLLNIFQFLSK